MNQPSEHLDALARDLTSIHHLVQKDKEKLDQLKQENMHLQMQLQQMSTDTQNNTMEVGKSGKICERLQTLLTQYLPLVPPEHQMKLQAELENSRQQPQVAPNMGMMHGLPSHMQQAMMMAHAQQAVQAAASRNSMMPGINSPASRLQKQNGMPNGAVPGMPPGMQNGMNLAMNQMMGMGISNMAQLQALAYSQMGAMGGIPGMPGFNPAQLAAMQGLGMSGMMPPMSVPGLNQSLAQQIPPHMNLSINTPSRNSNSNGPVSGSRTPQSVASPRQPKIEETATPNVVTDDKRISQAGDDTVAVA